MSTVKPMNIKVCYQCVVSIPDYNQIFHDTFSSTDKEFHCPVCKVLYPKFSDHFPGEHERYLEKTRTKYISEKQLEILISHRRETIINKVFDPS